MDDIILYDWLSFSAKWEDPYRMTALLGLARLGIDRYSFS